MAVSPCRHPDIGSMHELAAVRSYRCPDCDTVLKRDGGPLTEQPRTLADIQWVRRMAATRVQEAAAGVRVEHGRVLNIYDLAEAVDAYLEGERNGWPGRRP